LRGATGVGSKRRNGLEHEATRILTKGRTSAGYAGKRLHAAHIRARYCFTTLHEATNARNI